MRVVGVLQVGKFVDYDVVDDREGGHHVFPVEVQGSAFRAGSPVIPIKAEP